MYFSIEDRTYRQTCETHTYKTWFELIGPCFEYILQPELEKNHVCNEAELSPGLRSDINTVIAGLYSSILDNPVLSQQADLMWRAVQKQPFHQWCPGSINHLMWYKHLFQIQLRFRQIMNRLLPLFRPHSPVPVFPLVQTKINEYSVLLNLNQIQVIF